MKVGLGTFYVLWYQIAYSNVLKLEDRIRGVM